MFRRNKLGVLSAELHQPGGEACDLANGAQDVVPLFGVFAQVGDALGLGQQRSDVLLPLGTAVRICQPSLENTIEIFLCTSRSLKRFLESQRKQMRPGWD